MKIDINVLQQLSSTYGVGPYKGSPAEKLINSGQNSKADATADPILVGGDYQWDEGSGSYVNGKQRMYFSNSYFIWVLDNTLYRAFDSVKALSKWVRGDEKYPDGKANKFMETYGQLVGEPISSPSAPVDRDVQGGNIEFSGVGSRPAEVDDVDPTDALIASLTKKAGFRKTLPSDDLIKYGLEAKKTNNQKLLNFLKTITPLKENYIKKSKLAEIIQKIVKHITEELKIKEQSATAAASPVSGPNLKKKDDTIDEMTVTGNVQGYNVPGAFSGKGGSAKGIAGSAALGYELTQTGKKDMNRQADKL